MRKIKKTKNSQKQIDFYARYYYDPEAAAQKKLFIKAAIPLAALLVVVLGVFAFFKISDGVHKYQINKIEEYLSSSDTTQKYNEALQLQKEGEELAGIYSSMNKITEQADALPKMDSGVIGNINSALKGTEVVSYTYNSSQRQFAIVAKTSSAEDVPGIVKRLKALGDFSAASYTGYEDSDSKYVATISCEMAK